MRRSCRNGVIVLYPVSLWIVPCFLFFLRNRLSVCAFDVLGPVRLVMPLPGRQAGAFATITRMALRLCVAHCNYWATAWRSSTPSAMPPEEDRKWAGKSHKSWKQSLGMNSIWQLRGQGSTTGEWTNRCTADHSGEGKLDVTLREVSRIGQQVSARWRR